MQNDREATASRAEMKGPFDSRAVANKILDIANNRGINLTMMQLLKLVYIAHGWRLTFSGGKPLTSDAPQAWQYGPVYPAVYKAFRGSGNGVIKHKSVDPVTGFEIYEDIHKDVFMLLEQVVDAYGDKHAYVLSDMTHKPGTPWTVTSQNDGHYAPISNVIIKDHFDGLRQKQA